MKTLIAIAAMICATSASAQTYYNSNRLGNYEYYNGSDGYSGSRNRLGNYEYYHDNRGNNCTTSHVGNYAYTNCY